MGDFYQRAHLTLCAGTAKDVGGRIRRAVCGADGITRAGFGLKTIPTAVALLTTRFSLSISRRWMCSLWCVRRNASAANAALAGRRFSSSSSSSVDTTVAAAAAAARSSFAERMRPASLGLALAAGVGKAREQRRTQRPRIQRAAPAQFADSRRAVRSAWSTVRCARQRRTCELQQQRTVKPALAELAGLFWRASGEFARSGQRIRSGFSPKILRPANLQQRRSSRPAEPEPARALRVYSWPAGCA